MKLRLNARYLRVLFDLRVSVRVAVPALRTYYSLQAFLIAKRPLKSVAILPFKPYTIGGTAMEMLT